MASPIQFYRNFRALMQQHGIRHVLTSGMACVEYGIQQNTKDTDWIVQSGQWPSSEPFAQQHRRVAEAVIEFGLPAAPIATPEQKQAVFERGIQRALGLFAATPEELAAVLFPIEVILP